MILEKVVSELAVQLTPEVAFTAASIIDQYGAALDIDQYAEFMKLKRETVIRQISDETIAVRPSKFGKQNLFSAVDLAKAIHEKVAA